MMKLLKNITASLVESEDDLFPGLNTSVFDEHNTLRSNKRSAADESEWLDKHLERVKLLEKNHSRDFTRIKQYMMNNDIWIQSWNATVNSDVRYKSIAGLDTQFPLAYDLLANVYFNPNSPAKAKIPVYVTKMERTLERMQELKEKLKKMKTRASSTRRAATANEMKNQKASAPKTKIPEGNIPKTIPVKYFNGNIYKPQGTAPQWVTKDEDNPYWEKPSRGVITTERYAGHPVHFDWQKREKTSFFLLSKFVKTLGLPELSVLYIKRLDNRGNKPLFYMENVDSSFQIFQSLYGGINAFTQDTRLETWDSYVDVSQIAKWRDEIDLNTNLIQKYGKKP